MLIFLQRHVQASWLLVIAFTGLALGCLTATILGLSLGKPSSTSGPESERVAVIDKKKLADYATITQRNIFDSTSPGLSTALASTQASESPTVASSRPDLKLIGTVTGGDEDSLALIEADKVVKAYRLGDAIPGGGRLIAVIRNEAHIEYDDGISMLMLYQEGAPSRTPARPTPTTTDQTGIRLVEENRWLIDERVVEEARTNLGEVLKSARMEPRLVNDATNGFAITMLRPGSLLTRMGFKRGDVILEVNGVPLSSPEKALQIFQQLREARSLRVSLERRGQPTVLEYQVN